MREESQAIDFALCVYLWGGRGTEGYTLLMVSADLGPRQDRLLLGFIL